MSVTADIRSDRFVGCTTISFKPLQRLRILLGQKVWVTTDKDGHR